MKRREKCLQKTFPEGCQTLLRANLLENACRKTHFAMYFGFHC